MIGQPLCEVLELSSRVTTCSEMSNFLGVTVLLAEIVCFAKSIYIKDIGTKGASTKGVSISSTNAEGASTRVSSDKYTYISSAGTGNV